MMELWNNTVNGNGESNGEAQNAVLPDPPLAEGQEEGDDAIGAGAPDVAARVQFVDDDNEEDVERAPHPVGGDTFNKSPKATTGGGGRQRGSTVAVSMYRVPQNELPSITDHFSLSAPSSVIRFRRSNVRVYPRNKSQFVLEERATKRRDGNGGGDGTGSGVRTTITVKSMKNGGYALSILRATYTLVAVFVGGFLFIFSLELLLFLFIDLATEIGYTHTQGPNVMSFISVLLSVPVFVYALGSCMTIVGRFVADTWSGHPFLRTFGRWSNVVTDWASFVMYLGIPLLTASVTLLARRDDWWETTSLTWFATVLIFWGFFAGCVLYYEVAACLYLTQELGGPEVESFSDADGIDAAGGGGGTMTMTMTAAQKLRSIVINGQTSRLSGKRREMYLIDGDVEVPEGSGTFSASDDVEPYSTRTSIYSRFTTWRRIEGCLYTPAAPGGERFHTLDEARDVQPFVTTQSWSLEKMYCRDRESRAVAVIGGPSALTRTQARSSVACSVLGNLLVFLILVGLMVWFDSSPAFVGVAAVVILLCFVPGMMGTYRLFRTYRDVTRAKSDAAAAERELGGVQEDDGEGRVRGEESDAMYQVWETFRITRPRPQFCLAVFASEVLFLYMWPLLHLCFARNLPGAILFAFLGLFCGVRHYLNPAIVLKELGNFGTLGTTDKKKREREEGKRQEQEREHGIMLWASMDNNGDLYDASTDKEWKAKSRLNEIVGSIGSGRSRGVWNGMFMVLVLFFIVVVIASVAQGGGSDGQGGEFSALSAIDKMTLVSQDLFQYKVQPHLPYPTCQLKKGLEIPTGVSRSNVNNTRASSSMIDYAFVANVAYVKSGSGNDTSQFLLEQWFGDGQAIENVDVVHYFRTTAHPEYVNSVASYKLITFPAAPGFGVVAIRGTSNLWDLMADAQLWLAAGLFQGLREVLPIGGVWTPILHKVVRFVSALQTDGIEKVSFYKETTKFVEYLQRSGNYTSIQITGHSLGGGLALITGSQTNTPAVGLSAPNAMLSRDTFDPPLTEEQLNTLTFNIVPTRDVIPMLDDKANLYQNIECREGYFYECHAGMRSLCEAMYTCGSQDRPVICDCVRYGYEPPAAIKEGANFTQACQAAAEAAAS